MSLVNTSFVNTSQCRYDNTRFQFPPPGLLPVTLSDCCPFTKHLAVLVTVCVASLASVDAAEPMVPGYARFHADADLANGLGDLLLTELSCTSCHQAPAAYKSTLAPKGGPKLTGASRRIKASWMRKYLADPSAVKPGATMPGVLGHLKDEERDAVIEALIAYLGEAPFPKPTIVSTASNPVATEFWRKGDSARGQELYHQVGCVACHAPDDQFQLGEPNLSELEQRIQKLDLDPEELKELGLALPQPLASVPLSELGEKYTAQSLSLFLVDPLLIRPGERMPHLQLAPHEAADIAAHLLRDSTEVEQQAAPTDEQLVRDGAKWYAKFGCRNCHGSVGDDDTRANPAPMLTELSTSSFDSGCLADGEGDRSLPHYPLSEEQRASITSAMQRLISKSELDTPADVRWMLQLNCYACHARGERGGVGPKRWQFFENKQEVDLGDEGRLPPPLDHVGSKLTPKWLENVLRGKGAVRPHFQARMPTFAGHAKQVAAALRSVDRSTSESLPQFVAIKSAPAETLKTGRRLLNTGCVQCHPLFGEHLPGVMGVEISSVNQRIEPAWFQAFLKNPAQWKHGTRMPTFFPNGKSTSPDILDGDVEQQIAAMWTYLNAPKGELPEKLEQGRAHNFLLTPKDEPLVLRTFMQGNVTHAIAVGFPERLHYAFDSEAVALPLLWRGDFLNAHPTWFDRFTPPTKPLGDVWKLPPLTFVGSGPTAPKTILADAKITDRLASPTPLAFSGYRFDKRRVPSLLYRAGQIAIEERIAPEKNAGAGQAKTLRRRIQATTDDNSLSQTFWLAIGLEPQRIAGQRAEFGGGRSLFASTQLVAAELAGVKVALARLKVESGRGMLEVRYQWAE